MIPCPGSASGLPCPEDGIERWNGDPAPQWWRRSSGKNGSGPCVWSESDVSVSVFPYLGATRHPVGGRREILGSVAVRMEIPRGSRRHPKRVQTLSKMS
jgi:hypothetical protein